MKPSLWSGRHARSACFDRMSRSEHTALFERARGRGSGRAAAERWWSIRWLTRDSATWPRGDHYTLFARAAFKGSGSSRARTVGFALEGRGDVSPAPTIGGPPEGRRGSVGSRTRSETRTTSPLSHRHWHSGVETFSSDVQPQQPTAQQPNNLPFPRLFERSRPLDFDFFQPNNQQPNNPTTCPRAAAGRDCRVGLLLLGDGSAIEHVGEVER